MYAVCVVIVFGMTTRFAGSETPAPSLPPSRKSGSSRLLAVTLAQA